MFGKKKTLREEFMKVNSDLKDAQHVILELKEELGNCKENSRKTIESLTDELNKQKKETWDMESKYNSTIFDMKNSLRKKEDEIKALRNDLDKAPRLLSQIDIDSLRKEMRQNAWDGKSSKIVFIDTNGYPVLKLQGHMYEPGYESFNATCKVVGYDSYGKEHILFDENDRCVEPYRNETVVSGSEENIRNYMKEKDRYVLMEDKI